MSYQTRRLSPCLFWYITRNFLLPYACSLLAFMAIFLLNDVFNDLSDCISNHVAMHRILIYFLAKQPNNLLNVIPLSLLLAVSFMMMMLGRNNELTAMRAAGLSVSQCALPVWLIGGMSAVAVAVLSEAVGPRCARIAYQIESVDMYQMEAFNRLAFHHPSKHRDWFIESVAVNGEFQRVLVRQYREDGVSSRLTVAARASFQQGQWIFFDGYTQDYDATGRFLKGKRAFFRTAKMDYTETPADINAHSTKSENMNIVELLAVLKSNIIASERARNKIQALIWNKMTTPLISMVAVLFGVALTISTQRQGALKGFAIAIGLLVCCYLAGQLGLIVAQDGYLPPFVGGAAPNLAFTIAGIMTMRAKQ